MTGKTTISWTEHTWNPVVGCEAVSAGCDHCYAKTIHDMRYKAFLAGKNVAPQYAVPFEVVQLKPERLEWPLGLRKPSRIFVNSVSDLFHKDVPITFIDRVFAVMAVAQCHVFQVLTKRPARMRAYLTDPATRGRVARVAHTIAAARAQRRPSRSAADRIATEEPAFLWPLPNVWLGVSVESQSAANTRIPLLLDTPAAVRWISAEPLLGPVYIPEYLKHPLWNDIPSWQSPTIDWVVVGGESGDGARPMHPEWVRSLRDQCLNAQTPFHFKQYGAYRPITPVYVDSNVQALDAVDDDLIVAVDSYGTVFENGAPSNDPAAWFMEYVGKRDAGREFDGQLWDEYPGTRAAA